MAGGMNESTDYKGGLYIRSVLNVLRTIGCCPESNWPYVDKKYNLQPPKEAFDVAEDYQITGYARVPSNLDYLRLVLDNKVPIIGAFSCPKSIGSWGTFNTGFVGSDELDGTGHAVLFVGYDDNMEKTYEDGSKEKGFLIFKNSWGSNWGDDGYGYLPYSYVAEHKTHDFWIIYSHELGKSHLDETKDVQIAFDFDKPEFNFTVDKWNNPYKIYTNEERDPHHEFEDDTNDQNDNNNNNNNEEDKKSKKKISNCFKMLLDLLQGK
jgi:hypothetical protein